MAANDFAQKSDLDSSSALGGSRLLSSGGEWKPKSIIDAISEIQQFYVIESKGQNIPVEFLTLEGTLGFFKMGMGSGFSEAVFVFFLFPVFEFYLIPFVFHTPITSMKILLNAVPFALLIGNTSLCFYVSRYYVGTLTRKAINSLFLGRASILFMKSLLMYTLYFCAAKLATPERVWMLARYFNQNAESFYYGVLSILPHVIPAAIMCSIAMLLSAFLPYGSAYFLDRGRRRKLHKNQARVTGH